MKKIGIFYGSDTGNTEKIAKLIQKKIGKHICEIFDISNESISAVKLFDILIFGIPTWYYGELQCDWEDVLPNLKKIDLQKKTVALFGCGDQEDYTEYFCDAIGLLYNILKKKNMKFIGQWPIKNYYFESSKAQKNKTHFYGLTIDEDRQPELTTARIQKWVESLKKEISILHNQII